MQRYSMLNERISFKAPGGIKINPTLIPGAIASVIAPGRYLAFLSIELAIVFEE